MEVQPNPYPELERLDKVAGLLDDRFRIPGTRIRFGLDAFLGLIPLVGDIIGFTLAGLMFHAMWRRGAGPLVLLKMLGNIFLDALLGMFPVLGDLFDLAFKANRRNMNLLITYYDKNPERPHLGIGLAVLGLLFLALITALLWGAWLLLRWFWLSLMAG
jgi:hypothetical protein